MMHSRKFASAFDSHFQSFRSSRELCFPNPQCVKVCFLTLPLRNRLIVDPICLRSGFDKSVYMPTRSRCIDVEEAG